MQFLPGTKRHRYIDSGGLKIQVPSGRQPVILSNNIVENWLDPKINALDIQKLLQMPFPDDELDAYTVSKDLFNTKIDSNDASILEPVKYDELSSIV